MGEYADVEQRGPKAATREGEADLTGDSSVDAQCKIAKIDAEDPSDSLPHLGWRQSPRRRPSWLATQQLGEIGLELSE
jgi:hypothetical protein